MKCNHLEHPKTSSHTIDSGRKEYECGGCGNRYTSDWSMTPVRDFFIHGANLTIDFIKDMHQRFSHENMDLGLVMSAMRLAESLQDYEDRDRLMYKAMYLASNKGYKVGIRIDPEEPDWPVVSIKLPTGQVTWHTSQGPEWDGHDTDLKWKRVDLYKFAA